MGKVSRDKSSHVSLKSNESIDVLLDLKTLLLMTKFCNLTFSTISEILFEGVNSNGDNF